MSEAPPLYCDIGKAARDIIFKGYNYGISKVQVKSKKIDLNTSVLTIHETATSRGNIEHKYQWPKYGFTLTNKWNTENNFSIIFAIENSIIDGLKSTFETQVSPITGKKMGAIRNDFKHSRVRANVDVNVDFAGPIIKNGLVFRHANWLIGAGLNLDMSKYQVHSNSFSLQYAEKDITMHTSITNNSEFCGSFMQKVSSRTELAAILDWSVMSNNTRMTLGAKHSIDDQQTLRFKVNDAKQIALAYQIELWKGISTTVSTQIEGKNVQDGGHKIGFGLEINV